MREDTPTPKTFTERIERTINQIIRQAKAKEIDEIAEMMKKIEKRRVEPDQMSK